MSNKQEHQSYQNIIYTSILVTKECSKHLEQLFDDKLVYLQNMSNKQEHQSYQKIIHTSILVTKESSNIYMWNQNNRYVGWKSALN